MTQEERIAIDNAQPEDYINLSPRKDSWKVSDPWGKVSGEDKAQLGYWTLALLLAVVVAFTGYSCDAEENKLKAKCIEARGMWLTNQGCVFVQGREPITKEAK